MLWWLFMNIKLIPQNNKFLLGLEVGGTELELLKLDEKYRFGKLKYLLYDVEFNKGKSTFTIIKDDFEIVKGILNEIEREVEKVNVNGN